MPDKAWKRLERTLRGTLHQSTREAQKGSQGRPGDPGYAVYAAERNTLRYVLDEMKLLQIARRRKG